MPPNFFSAGRQTSETFRRSRNFNPIHPAKNPGREPTKASIRIQAVQACQRVQAEEGDLKSGGARQEDEQTMEPGWL